MRVKNHFIRNGFAASVMLLTLTFGYDATAAVTSLSLKSDPGDYIGGGQTLFFSESDGIFTAQRNSANGVSVAFNTPTFDHFWYLDFAAPDNQFLTVGTYQGAVRFPFQGPGQPGLAVYGDGRGCNTDTGSFNVLEVTYGSNNDVTAFWATFEQHCEGAVPALRGEIRFNADVIVDLTAPTSLSVVTGQNLAFNVTATDNQDRHVVLTATGLPPGGTFTDNSDNTGTFNWTPTFGQVGSYVVTFHGDNGQGNTQTVFTGITVIPPTVTSLLLKSDPGDYIGGGQTLFFSASDGTFTAQHNFANGVSVAFNAPTHFWYLDFAAPDNQLLTVGTYQGAVRFPFQGPGQPGLSVAGDGRGCNTLTGIFNVLEVTYGSNNDVTAFWATFEQHCEGAVPALRGEIRFHADVIVNLTAPTSLSVDTGQNLAFNVTATDNQDRHVVLTATGLPPGGTFTDNGDNTGTFNWTPTTGQVGSYEVAFHGDNGQGNTQTVITGITVIPPTTIVMGKTAPPCGGAGPDDIGFVDCTSNTGGFDVIAMTTITAGDTVRWTATSTPHTVTTEAALGGGFNAACGTGDNFDSGIPNAFTPGFVYTHQFNTPGTCTYFCIFHSSIMQGQVNVAGGTTTTATVATTTTTTVASTTTTRPTTTTTVATTTTTRPTTTTTVATTTTTTTTSRPTTTTTTSTTTTTVKCNDKSKGKAKGQDKGKCKGHDNDKGKGRDNDKGKGRE